jgi:hypothetical protein
MAKVQLKQNLIFGGQFYRFDTVLDEEELPLDRRGPEFVKPPEPPPEPELDEIEISDGPDPDFWDNEPEEPPEPPKKKK